MAWLIAGLSTWVAAFALSALFCEAIRRLAPRVGLVDVPGGRKAHRAPTPLGGGLAIWLALTVVFGAGQAVIGPGRGWLPSELAEHAAGLSERAPTLWLLFGLGTAVMLMGLADDARGLGWRVRLAAQFGLATAFVVFGARATLFPPFSEPLVSGAITVLWIVGLTNSFNFLDNMDGLAAGVALTASALLAAAQIMVGGLFVPAALVALTGALCGFLLYNKPPARMFMGDAGSNLIGFLLAGLCVLGTFARVERDDAPYAVLTPLLVMAVPLYDTFSVILIRLREGRSPFQADRRHFSHRLVARGLTPPGAVRTILLVTLAGGLGTLLLPRLDSFGALVVLTQTLCLLGVVAILEAAPSAASTSTSTSASGSGSGGASGAGSSAGAGVAIETISPDPESSADGRSSAASEVEVASEGESESESEFGRGPGAATRG